LLQRRHEVALFEKNDYVGGHTHTIVIDHGPDAGTPVDTAFIVLNDRTYPLLMHFLAGLGVPIRKSDMSFSYTCRRSGLQYASRNLDTLFAQRQNLLRPAFWRFLIEIVRFNVKTRKKLTAGALQGLSLGEYLRREAVLPSLVESYLIPMAAAIWSTPGARMMDFPAESFFRFMENHGLLSVSDQPQWYCVEGGSHAYVKAFLHGFKGRVFTDRPKRVPFWLSPAGRRSLIRSSSRPTPTRRLACLQTRRRKRRPAFPPGHTTETPWSSTPMHPFSRRMTAPGHPGTTSGRKTPPRRAWSRSPIT
jgi:predicted NAD/FAD-binding protein